MTPHAPGDDLPNKPGEFAIRDTDYGDGQRGPRIVFTCPRGKGLCGVPLHPSPPLQNGAIWTWDGNRDAPTIIPSINCLAEKDGKPAGGCGWHGFITRGVIK